MTNELILEHSNLIYSVAKKFESYKNRDDLFQVGCLGLILAYKNYDPKLNAKFTTYAYPYILGEMCKLVREDKGIKISRNVIKLKNSIEKAKNYLAQKLERNPSIEEISEFLNISKEEINYALKTINILSSIDEPISSDGKEINLYDITPDSSLDMDTLITLKEELLNLDQDSKNLLLYSFEGLTQQQIADIFNMNQVQISRNLTKIKTKIKKNIA